MCLHKRLTAAAAAAENITSVSDAETITLFKLMHETNPNVMFLSCYIHCLRFD